MEDKKPIQSSKPKSDLFQQVFFFVLGVSSLSGWNAVLTGLAYFANKYPEHDVFFTMPVPNFLAMCIFGIALPKLSNYLSLTFRIAWSLIILSGLLVLLPIWAVIFPNEFGYWTVLCIIFLLGTFNCLQQNSSIGIASMLGFEYVNLFFLGTGLSGAIICIFRFISLAAIDQEQPGQSVIMYFSVAAVWNVGAVFMYFAFVKTENYRKVGAAHRKGKASMLVHDHVVTDPNLMTDVLSSDISLAMKEDDDEPVNIEKMGVFQTLIWINKVAFPVPLCIIWIYIETFMMFPGLSLGKQFPADFADWGATLIIFAYNVGDSVGKFLAGWRKLYSQTILIVILFIRFAFFYFFIEIVLGVRYQADWIAYLNIFIFATLNGFLTTGFMQLGPEKSEEGFIKEKIGFVSGFSLCFGIMLGTFLALPLKAIKPIV